MSLQHARTPEHQHQPVWWSAHHHLSGSVGRFARRTLPVAQHRGRSSTQLSLTTWQRPISIPPSHTSTIWHLCVANIYAISLRICCRHSDSTSQTTDIDVFVCSSHSAIRRVPGRRGFRNSGQLGCLNGWTPFWCIYILYIVYLLLCLGSPTNMQYTIQSVQCGQQNGGSCCWLWLCVGIFVFSSIYQRQINYGYYKDRVWTPPSLPSYKSSLCRSNVALCCVMLRYVVRRRCTNTIC